MVQAHALDAWTRTADRSTLVFRELTILGGCAAPLFLWLAGLALVLSAEGKVGRISRRHATACAVVQRGLEIFILAFLFRLQALLLSPGGPLVMLFRVDILNVMGLSIAAAGVVWAFVPSRTMQIIAFGGLTGAVAMLTPIVEGARWVGALPIWLQWYLRQSGEYTTFTGFPWAGFVFAGAALGVLVAAALDDRSERRLQIGLAAAGSALIVLGSCAASLPTIYRSSSFWTTSPTFFVIRVGLMMAGLAAIYGLSRLTDRLPTVLRPLEKLGRNSLFVYWIHVELVYGYASWPIHGRLPLWGTAVAYVAFCALLYGAVLARHRVVELWRARRPILPAPQTAGA
jgi:uncharacterized membrane protein